MAFGEEEMPFLGLFFPSFLTLSSVPSQSLLRNLNGINPPPFLYVCMYVCMYLL